MQGNKNKITVFHLLKGHTFLKENRWRQETGEQNQNTGSFLKKEQWFQPTSFTTSEFV